MGGSGRRVPKGSGGEKAGGPEGEVTLEVTPERTLLNEKGRGFFNAERWDEAQDVGQAPAMHTLCPLSAPGRRLSRSGPFRLWDQRPGVNVFFNPDPLSPIDEF